MWIYIVIGVVVLIIILTIVMFNSFVKINNKVEEAFSTMDVYLKKRWDLIPNIVETVKEYAEHEKETLKEIVELRNTVYDKMSSEDKITTNEKLDKDINKVMLVAEAYPTLKANENFADLTKQLIKVEEDIANSRKYYNGVIRIYNNKIAMFPNNIFAKVFGYTEKNMFEVTETERENVKLEI